MKRPLNELELSEVVAGAEVPLRVAGGGTRGFGAGDLSVAGISGVVLYEPGALTLVVRAGTPLREVEALLASEGQRLAFEPMDHRALLGTGGEPTIGGVVAGNVSGPRRVQVGACRDALLGVRFVDGRGKVIKNGGRVMKNVTGYDLVKLMAGSFGTLGVLSEVSLKVLPMPEVAATLVCDGLDAVAGVAALSRALGSPFEVTGAAIVGGQARVRIEGLAASVKYRSARLLDLLGAGWEVGAGELWQEVRDVLPFAARAGAVWRVSVKPSDGPVLTAALGVEHEAIYDWGGGLIWVLVAEGVDIRPALKGFSGHATLIRASDDMRAKVARFQPEPAPLAAISAGLRAQFDPRGIFNQGLMG